MTKPMSAEELAAARSNVDKFAPSHGWANDRRASEQLTTGELLSYCAWLENLVDELTEGTS